MAEATAIRDVLDELLLEQAGNLQKAMTGLEAINWSGFMSAEGFSLTAEVGRRVRTAREAARLSQDDLAEKAGLSRPTIARIERGAQKQIKPRTIRRIAAALDKLETEFYPFELSSPALTSLVEHSDLPLSLRRSLIELLDLPDLDRQAMGTILEQLLVMRRAISSQQGQPS